MFVRQSCFNIDILSLYMSMVFTPDDRFSVNNWDDELLAAQKNHLTNPLELILEQSS